MSNNDEQLPIAPIHFGIDWAKMPDFPKIEAPFVRRTYSIDHKDWNKYGSSYQLRNPDVYLVTPEFNERCSWVTKDETYAVEKLHGTCVSINVYGGRLVLVQNRLQPIDFTKIVTKSDGLPPSARVLEGILQASDKGFVRDNEVQYGELIGPRVNGNIYNLDKHLWYPFKRACESLRYKSFNKFPKEFWGWCDWFRSNLISMFHAKHHKIKITNFGQNSDLIFAEGIIIYLDQPDGNPWMSKLRRDMYPWYYWDKIHIHNLDDYWLDYAREKGLSPKGYSLT